MARLRGSVSAIDVYLASKDIRRVRFYDSFQTPTDRDYPTQKPYLLHPTFRLFINRNIGIDSWCNLEVGGYFGGDTSMIVDHWYARTDLDAPIAVRSAFERWAKTVKLTLIIGDRPSWHQTLDELLRSRPWIPEERIDHVLNPEEAEQYRQRMRDGHVPTWIPVRQNYCVRVDHAYEGHFNDLVKACEKVPEMVMPRIWLNLEGLQIREPV